MKLLEILHAGITPREKKDMPMQIIVGAKTEYGTYAHQQKNGSLYHSITSTILFSKKNYWYKQKDI